MPSYVNLTITKQLTLVTLPSEITADCVTISATFNGPTALIFLLSDIVKPQYWNGDLKPVLGHIPTSSECYRNLHTTTFKQFYIALENSDGKAYTPARGFHVELLFRHGDHIQGGNESSSA
jgi:hypothetical protein